MPWMGRLVPGRDLGRDVGGRSLLPGGSDGTGSSVDRFRPGRLPVAATRLPGMPRCKVARSGLATGRSRRGFGVGDVGGRRSGSKRAAPPHSLAAGRRGRDAGGGRTVGGRAGRAAGTLDRRRSVLAGGFQGSGTLGLSRTRAACSSGGRRGLLGADAPRPLRAPPPRSRRVAAFPAGTSRKTPPPPLSRSDRLAPFAAGSRCVPRRSFAPPLGSPRRRAAGATAIR